MCFCFDEDSASDRVGSGGSGPTLNDRTHLVWILQFISNIFLVDVHDCVARKYAYLTLKH